MKVYKGQHLIVQCYTNGHIPAGVQKLFAGDPRCSIPIEAKIVIKDADPEAKHQNGSEGTVIGSLFIEDLPEKEREHYVISWDDEETYSQGVNGSELRLIFIAGFRLKLK